jgi:hypothetical protein
VIGALEDAEDYKRSKQPSLPTMMLSPQSNGNSLPASREVVYALFRRAHSVSYDRDLASDGVTNATTVPSSGSKSVEPALDTTVELARCFVRLANLPNFALDRFSRYEATLWRQAGRILYALDALDRRKPQERRRRSRVDDWRERPTSEDHDCLERRAVLKPPGRQL